MKSVSTSQEEVPFLQTVDHTLNKAHLEYTVRHSFSFLCEWSFSKGSKPPNSTTDIKHSLNHARTISNNK